MNPPPPRPPKAPAAVNDKPPARRPDKLGIMKTISLTTYTPDWEDVWQVMIGAREVPKPWDFYGRDFS